MNPFIVNSDPNEAKYAVQNLAFLPGLSVSRMEDRRKLLAQLDQWRAGADSRMADMDAHSQAAMDFHSTTFRDSLQRRMSVLDQGTPIRELVG